MTSKSPFFASFKKTLQASGAPIRIDITGSFFYCKESSAAFQMRHSDGQFYDWDQSFSFNLATAPDPDGLTEYTFLEFKAKDGATADVVIYFVIGNRTVSAALNMIRDPNAAQMLRTVQSQTLVKGFAAALIAAGSSATFYGTGGTGAGLAGGAYGYRHLLYITNNDPGSDLEVYASDGTTRLMTAFHGFVTQLETSDDLIIKNETAADIACRICEVFYPANL